MRVRSSLRLVSLEQEILTNRALGRRQSTSTFEGIEKWPHSSLGTAVGGIFMCACVWGC